MICIYNNRQSLFILFVLYFYVNTMLSISINYINNTITDAFNGIFRLIKLIIS